MRTANILSIAPLILFWSHLYAAEPVKKEFPRTVTFSEHISPIIFENCTGCHRAGQVAPFQLTNYAEVKKRSKTMLGVMQARTMPPWQPETGHVAFQNERRLSDYQIALFEKWVETGSAEGDAAKMPALPKFPEGWQLGKPDLIVKMDRPFTVPASGPDIYQNFVIPLNVDEDKWVSAIEFRATAPAVVHHVLYILDDSGRARGKEPKEGQPGFAGMGMGFRPSGSLGGWAVGAAPLKLPEGLAYPLKKNSDLVLQTHFHPSGKVETETLTVGIYSASKPKRTIVGLQLPPAFGLFSNLDIPAGKADFRINDSFTLPCDVELIGAGGHAHTLAKTLKTTASLPDKTVKTLFEIRDWDFNWQGQYLYKEPIRLPKGTVIRGEVMWDNSAENPRNANKPPIRITWGEATIDEMGSVGLLMLAANEADAAPLRDAIRTNTMKALVKSKVRGDKIDLQKLGFPPNATLEELLKERKK